jgi:hypothetical protein
MLIFPVATFFLDEKWGRTQTGTARQNVFMLKKIYDQLFKKSSSPKANSQPKPKPDVLAAFFQELDLYRPVLICIILFSSIDTLNTWCTDIIVK